MAEKPVYRVIRRFWKNKRMYEVGDVYLPDAEETEKKTYPRHVVPEYSFNRQAINDAQEEDNRRRVVKKARIGAEKIQKAE